MYTVVGQKLILCLRPTMEELNEIETELNKTTLAEYMVPAYSYVSVVELSNYLPADEDPYQNPQILARLYPELPKANHIASIQWISVAKVMTTGTCFLWKSVKMMYSHSKIGRQYAGKVRQVISAICWIRRFRMGRNIIR